MARPKSLANLTVDALLQLRDDVTSTLQKRTGDLQRQLASLTGSAPKTRGRPAGSKSSKGPAKGSKVAPKYRGPAGETWSGRGLKPRWLSAALKDGRSIEEFAISKSAGGMGGKSSRKAAKRKK